MRVLYFSDNYSVHNQRFLEKLSASGHVIWFLASHSRTSPANWLPGNVRQWEPLITVPSGSSPHEYLPFIPEFKRCVQELQPDLVHAGPVQSAAYVAVLAQFHPLLVTSWGSDLLFRVDRNTEWERATEDAMHGADAFFCDCNAVRTAAQSFASLPDSQIVQFPWGIPAGRFSPEGPLPESAELKLDADAIAFISTRSWEPLYGIDTMLEAFRIAHSQNPRLRLLLFGTGSQAGKLHQFIASHQLTDVVLTPGIISQEESPKWFRAAKGYISCTQSDGTSISLLEAMATGLPVVVTDLPANREWVVAGENGWLAPAGSSEQFAGNLLQMANLTASQRQEMAACNQEVVAQRADWDKNFPQLLTMYEHLVARGKR